MKTSVNFLITNQSVHSGDHPSFDTGLGQDVVDHAGSAGLAVGTCYTDHAQAAGREVLGRSGQPS